MTLLRSFSDRRVLLIALILIVTYQDILRFIINPAN